MFTRRLASLLIAAVCCVRTCSSAALSGLGTPQADLRCPSYSSLGNDNHANGWSLLSLAVSDDDPCTRGTFGHTPGYANVTHATQDQLRLNRRNLSMAPTPTVRREEGTSSDLRPTPQPTGHPSKGTTVHITSKTDFALLLPNRDGELISDAESDGIAYCTGDASESSCADRPRLPTEFIAAAALSKSADGSWIQVTGCLDATKFRLDPSDDGGQFDVRFPNGAQCTFGGYGASFIELIEPAKNRFCLRCCASPNDQTHCNSHQDRLGCETAVPGQYDFPEMGVSCS